MLLDARLYYEEFYHPIIIPYTSSNRTLGVTPTPLGIIRYNVGHYPVSFYSARLSCYLSVFFSRLIDSATEFLRPLCLMTDEEQLGP